MKKVISLLLCLLLIASLAGCGSSAKSAAYDTAAAPTERAYDAASGALADVADYAMASEEEGYWDNGAAYELTSAASKSLDSDTTSNVTQNSKIIYTANYEMETMAFDESTAALDALVESMGGYFENRGLYNYNAGYRSGSYTVRVPADKYRAFCDAAGSQFNVTYFNESAENISEIYYDTEARLETASIKLERLQTLLKQATSMEDIITIENAISDVEYTIEALSGELRHYDAMVDYATVYINLQEVYKLSGTEIAPLTFGQRLGSSFVNGLRSVGDFFENLVMGLAYSWIYLLLIAAVIVLIVRLCKKKGVKVTRCRREKKRKSCKNAPPLPADDTADDAAKE